MHSTNYQDTLITVAPDTKALGPTEPPDSKQTIASLQFGMLSGHDYELTSDDLLFSVHVVRKGIGVAEQEAAREAFFSRGQACLRTSPLPKTYGWGLHFDSAGRVALVPLGSTRYDELLADDSITKTAAVRSSRPKLG
ncbi:MAG TPA: DUF6157 family protein [Marmoricola sp.]|nr:DUF6157 family protein [Marmoricola sp.]HNI70820.1 DUF6157 family protein [Marmoricola sp.]HNO40138.1 DUF6157 family protein [Marmoricola sp.]